VPYLVVVAVAVDVVVAAFDDVDVDDAVIFLFSLQQLDDNNDDSVETLLLLSLWMLLF
jgi:hypothetical protein